MKQMQNFLLRTVNLLLILAVLWQYQQIATRRAAAVDARQQEIDAVNAYNASILQTEEEASKTGLSDGTYEGSAYGFGDLITVSVTIRDGKMTDISVLSATGEDRPYYDQSLPLLDRMISLQSTEIDTVSGATLTSEGLIGAVADALGKAGA